MQDQISPVGPFKLLRELLFCGQDLRGSSSELWAFHFPSETWHLVSQGGAVDGPPARHR